MAKVTRKKRRRSSSTTSFSSLPDDVALNILARVSRIHYPTLSLVSKSLRSLVSSRELKVTRTLTGKTENYHYLCLKHSSNNHKSWFLVSPITKQKLIAIPAFPFGQYPDNPSVISTGSEIYIIGGYVNRNRSRRVFLLDCRLHQWRRLPDMRFPRVPLASFIQGKIYVFGGCDTPCNDNWGEIYDPNTESWEPLSPTTVAPDINFHKRVKNVPHCFVRQEKIWFCKACDLLEWCDLEDNLGWRVVKGLERLDIRRIKSMENSDGGKTVTLWLFYDTYRRPSIRFGYPYITPIWCAEISFERRSREELFGILEWSKKIYTMMPSERARLSLSSCATVTH